MGDELASTQADSLVPFHSHQDIELRKLLTHFGLIERFTPLCSRRRPRATQERRSKGVAGKAAKRGSRRTNLGGRDDSPCWRRYLARRAARARSVGREEGGSHDDRTAG